MVQGLLDGTINMIATDHAPHSAEEKARGLEKSAFGVVGIETAFPIIYTYLVKPGILPLERAVDLLCANPRKRFGLNAGPGLQRVGSGCRKHRGPQGLPVHGKSNSL